MGIDRGNETTTQLLTLLNVSATKAGKRKWESDDTRPKEKLNKRRVVLLDEPTVTIVDTDEAISTKEEGGSKKDNVEESHEDEKDDEEQGVPGTCLSLLYHLLCSLYYVEGTVDPYESHFGLHPTVLSESKRNAIEKNSWKTARNKFGKLGNVVEYIPDVSENSTEEQKSIAPAVNTPSRITGNSLILMVDSGKA